jgi:hypothetical protein
LIPRFQRFYPGAWYSPAYPTRDHVIPWQRFALMMAAVPRLRTGEQLDASYAMQHGTVAAKGAAQPLLFKALTDELERFAYPTLADLEAEDPED